MDTCAAIRAAVDLRSALSGGYILDMVAYDEVLARNVRARRSRLGIGQERLAARMRALGYTAFLRQTVSKVEKAERRLSASEVHGLAWALETSMAALLEPALDDKQVQFPSGNYLGAASVASSVRGHNDGSIEWRGDVPMWIGVSYPPGSVPEVEAWRASRGGEALWPAGHAATGASTTRPPAAAGWALSTSAGIRRPAAAAAGR
jgi:hypothetical protein